MLGTSSQYKDHFSDVESNITFAMKHGLDSEVKLASEGEERGQILSDLLGSRSSSQVPDSRLQSQRIEMTASNSGALRENHKCRIVAQRTREYICAF